MPLKKGGFWIALMAWLSVSLAGGAVADAPFPRPPELQDRVEFWKKVFAAYDTHQGIVHDREDLSIIYGVVELGKKDRASQRAAEEEILARYRRALARLAEGEIDPRQLTDEEWRVWQAHGQSRDPERYRRAQDRLRLQVGQRDRFQKGLENWKRYGEKMRQIFREHGLPDSLVALAFVESAFDPQARSKAGAVGLWQITRPAGRHLLRMDRRVDEREDPLKATVAAAKILKRNYELLGTWPLAITAYNHGTAGIARGVREVGSKDLVQLIRHYQGQAFGFASKNFYAEFLAALEVIPHYPLYYGEEIALSSSFPLDRGRGDSLAVDNSPVAHLDPNVPNPFNQLTTLTYSLEKPRLVQVDIYNVAGQRFRSLVHQVQGPGTFQVCWDGTSDSGMPAATGIYFVRLQAGNLSIFRKMMLLR